MKDAAKGKALKTFLEWMVIDQVTDGSGARLCLSKRSWRCAGPIKTSRPSDRSRERTSREEPRRPRLPAAHRRRAGVPTCSGFWSTSCGRGLLIRGSSASSTTSTWDPWRSDRGAPAHLRWSHPSHPADRGAALLGVAIFLTEFARRIRNRSPSW
jgi:hypothetical protein